MMKLVEAFRMRRAWLRLARQRTQLFGVNSSGHLRILQAGKEISYFSLFQEI